jgi:hypothetical protein
VPRAVLANQGRMRGASACVCGGGGGGGRGLRAVVPGCRQQSTTVRNTKKCYFCISGPSARSRLCKHVGTHMATTHDSLTQQRSNFDAVCRPTHSDQGSCKHYGLMLLIRCTLCAEDPHAALELPPPPPGHKGGGVAGPLGPSPRSQHPNHRCYQALCAYVVVQRFEAGSLSQLLGRSCVQLLLFAAG